MKSLWVFLTVLAASIGQADRKSIIHVSGCEAEAQVQSGKVLSVEYIANLGCKAQVGELRQVLPNPFCALFDVDIEEAGVILSAPSERGCIFKAGDIFSGIVEKHGDHLYLFTPSVN